MKTYRLFAILALGSWLLVLPSCEPKPEPEPEVIPESFPRKHLIEEFTGQSCGYCPYGMDCVHDFMANDTNYILVLHHYGFAADHFSVAGSKTITSALKVSGAPNITIDRAKTKSSNGTNVVFHPGYLPSVNKNQFETTTYASVNIRNAYDPATRELRVFVSGVLCKEDYPDLKLTVLVKESGMIDYQADNFATYEGWQEFRHANAVRAFLSDNPKGDPITIRADRHYEEQFVIDLKSTWNAENCMVVAFLSEEFQPVVQAAQKPVVEGTKGGADILHGGVTAVPVADYYPEPNATSGPADYSNNKSETFTTSYAYYEQFPDYGVTMWTIQAWNKESIVTVNKTQCIPFANLIVLAPYNATPTLPTGVFPVNATAQAGTVIAGYRDDAKVTIDGSMLYFTGLNYFNQGYLDPQAQWLIADGEMTITDQGWTLSGHARNGAAINLEGSALVNQGSANAPSRLRRKEPSGLRLSKLKTMQIME